MLEVPNVNEKALKNHHMMKTHHKMSLAHDLHEKDYD